MSISDDLQADLTGSGFEQLDDTTFKITSYPDGYGNTTLTYHFDKPAGERVLRKNMGNTHIRPAWISVEDAIEHARAKRHYSGNAADTVRQFQTILQQHGF